jgi:hypothetical protein
MNLPRFEAVPAPVKRTENRLTGKTEESLDTKAPTCPCGWPGPIDASGICRPCWRVCVLAPAYAREIRRLAALPAEPPPAAEPSNDIERARDVRDHGRLPSVTTAPTPTGVSADIDLGGQPSGKGPRRRG